MNYKAFSVVRQVEGIMQSQEMSPVGENKRISMKSEFPSSSAQVHTIWKYRLVHPGVVLWSVI